MVYCFCAPSCWQGGLAGRLRWLAVSLLFVALLLQTGRAFAQQDNRVQARLALSAAYFHADMLTFAMVEADKALLVSEQAPDALAMKAVIYQRQGRLDLAERYFLQASLMAPNSPQIAHNWAVLACQQEKFEDAFAKFASAEAQSEGLDRDKTLWLWGDCLRQNNQLDAANLKMSQALQRQPGFISEGLTLAKLKLALGRDAEAEKILDLLNDSPSVSAQSLGLSVQLAHRQNQAVKKNHWGKMLGLLFSNSAQWRAYQEEVSHE